MGLRNRKNFIEEKCFFVTSVCHNKLKLFSNKHRFKILTDSLAFCAAKYEADFLSYVLMPNHIHFVIFFRKENRLSDLMRDFKKFTSGEIRRMVEQENQTIVFEALRFKRREQKFKVWKDRFDDVWLRKRDLVETKIRYIHNNPIQENWQLVRFEEHYEYSSARFYNTGKQGPLKVVHYREYFLNY